MKKLFVLVFIFSIVIIISSFTKDENPSVTTRYNLSDTTLQGERDKFTKQVLEMVKNNKEMYADSVFVNLQTFNGAQRLKVTHLLAVMNYWSEALGVSCTHCHNTAMWESDEIPQKKIARDMYVLRQLTNEQVQYSVKNLHRPVVQINCGTCHRGSIKPVSD